MPFEFSVVATGDYAAKAPMPEAPKISVAPKAGETDAAKLNNITATFGAMTFNKSHLSTEAGTNKDYAKTYTYTVKETKPTNAIAGLHYSQAEYTVTVTVPADMGTPTVSIKQVKDDNGEPVNNRSVNVAEFTNTYVAVSALPLTGGTTDRQWLLVGGSIGGLAVLLIGAAEIWNNKKRLV